MLKKLTTWETFCHQHSTQDLLWIGSDPLRTLRLLDRFGSNLLFTKAVFFSVLIPFVSTALRTRWLCLKTKSIFLKPDTSTGWSANNPKKMSNMITLWALQTIFFFTGRNRTEFNSNKLNRHRVFVESVCCYVPLP